MITIYSSANMPSDSLKKEIITFLHVQLESYGDPYDDIAQAIDYALQIGNKPGGAIITSWDNAILNGVAVLNKTGMKNYIPENILVYIAIHKNYRGRGLSKELMQKVIDLSLGDIALHVEPHNPVIKLYEKFGFTNKYLEMRLKK